MSKALVKAIEYYLPENVLDNYEIAEEHPEWSIEKIAAKTGILRRHIADKNEFASDMAIKAADKLFAAYSINKNEIDFILLCTQSPDYFLPTTACILQERLGLSKKCGALDFNLGCSGFIYGLGLAKGLICTGQAKNVLLITSETYSKFIHSADKNNKTLFGDGAAATLITSLDDNQAIQGQILEFVYGTDGSGANALIVKNGGAQSHFRRNHSIESLEPGDDHLFMDGKAIFEFTAFTIPLLVQETLDKNHLSMDDIDLFVFHQANQFMLNTIRKRAGISEDKFFIYLKDCGNTVSSTIPIAIMEAQKQGRIKKGDKVFLAGFGVGLSMGATILQF